MKWFTVAMARLTFQTFHRQATSLCPVLNGVGSKDPNISIEGETRWNTGVHVAFKSKKK